MSNAEDQDSSAAVRRSALALVVSHADGAPTSDAMLIAQARDGNATAFRELVARYLPRARQTAERVLGRNSSADDAAQEAFIRLWQSLADLDVGKPGVWPWLRRVLVNLCIDRRRARRDGSPALLERLVSPDAPDSDAEKRDLSRRVRTVIDALPDRQRAAMLLFHFEGARVQEIADTLDASIEATESLLSRARRQVKKELATEWRDLLPESCEDGPAVSSSLGEFKE
ncbi:MAG: sigma-70 family RNA polymerase sigma factor [Pseudomonadota bacterium]